MLVKPNERLPLAALLQFLELGERLAHSCATTQAALAPTSKIRDFLKRQARQEAMHATIFRTTRKWIAPRQPDGSNTLKPFEDYRSLLCDSLDRKQFLESILAEQVILESLGEAILHKIEIGLQKRHAPFQRLRRMLLAQEAAHHGFGNHVLQRAVADHEITKEQLQEQAIPYLLLSQSMIMELHALFQEIDEDPQEFLDLQQQHLPPWLVTRNTKHDDLHNHSSL
ncbi:hypothetical protein [Candidatus Nitronereus thalassa]|uniref:Ferritin-like domain-containing protein n=1 Tax=Candidatus Nitronereus thalassa TaxID=3020898 RepID=A0ABU3KC03_9BACT|nr:hypothetical protein [Candidatus Nitronereus thalassa]MDT7044045.1 hypothetical protein [Candidatus Nitronereus thalassa]